MVKANAVCYPFLERFGLGFKVRISKGATLPGIYLGELVAQKAILKHVALAKAAKRKK